MWIFTKKSFQYQIAEFCYHDKFWVEALALHPKVGVTSELQIDILVYIGYEDLYEKVILLRDVLLNWVVYTRVNTRSKSWN